VRFSQRDGPAEHVKAGDQIGVEDLHAPGRRVGIFSPTGWWMAWPAT
jgi:hypothetical protein